MNKIAESHTGVYGITFDEKQEKVLLILKGRGPYKGMYDLPGGGIEEGESNKQALKREFEEEIGCDIAQHTFLYEDMYEFDYISESRGEIHFKHTGFFYEVTLSKGAEIKATPDGHDSMGAVYIDLKQIEDNTVTVAPMAKKAILSLVR